MKTDRPLSFNFQGVLEVGAAWFLALLWIAPLAYAFWAAFHPGEYAVHFDIFAPLTLANFREALSQAPFLRYALNTFILVSTILTAQLVLCTLAAYAFARYRFFGSDIAFALVLVQLMISPEILIVENYGTLARFELIDTILGIGLPYMASAFGIFLLRQAFKSTPKELEEAARLEGCGVFGVLWRVVCALGAPYLPRLWAGLHQPPLEQFPVAPGRDQFGGNPALDGWTGYLRRPGIRRGLVDYHGSHPNVRRAATDCLSAVPTAIRAVFHARGD